MRLSRRTTPGWSPAGAPRSRVRLGPGGASPRARLAQRPPCPGPTLPRAHLAQGPPRPRSGGFPYDTTMDAAIPSAPSNAPAPRAAQQSLVVSSLAEILPVSSILYRGEDTAPYE